VSDVTNISSSDGNIFAKISPPVTNNSPPATSDYPPATGDYPPATGDGPILTQINNTGSCRAIVVIAL
jgi:hypothetical protein